LKHRIYEVDSDGYLHDAEESEDVMDLDEQHVMNFVDVNHEFVEATARQNEGRGFYEALEDILTEDEIGLSDEDIDEIENRELARAVAETEHEG
jgi:hypothetical protein